MCFFKDVSHYIKLTNQMSLKINFQNIDQNTGGIGVWYHPTAQCNCLWNLTLIGHRLNLASVNHFTNHYCLSCFILIFDPFVLYVCYLSYGIGHLP